VIEQGRRLGEEIEQALLRLEKLPAIAAVRGECAVWGVECAPVGKLSADEVANEIVRSCYRGDEQGLAIHLLGPLSGKVIRLAPPLTMPLGEAREYLGALHRIVSGIKG
jgi:4-aminobutyrate aminotransferase-like enzyme